jgi:hypothetical protein
VLYFTAQPLPAQGHTWGVMHHDEDFRVSTMWTMMCPQGSLPLHVGGILAYKGSQEEANPGKAQR